MNEVQLNNTVSFSDYVYQDMSIETSATRSPVLNLDPQYTDIPVWHRYNSMQQLARHVETSIMAYRAVAWWACRLDWRKRTWQDEVLIKLARSISDARKKPTEFQTMWGIRNNGIA